MAMDYETRGRVCFGRWCRFCATYSFINVPLMGNSRAKVMASVHQVRRWLGSAVLLDAAAVGSRAHRPRLWWTNLMSPALLKRALDGMQRPYLLARSPPGFHQKLDYDDGKLLDVGYDLDGYPLMYSDDDEDEVEEHSEEEGEDEEKLDDDDAKLLDAKLLDAGYDYDTDGYPLVLSDDNDEVRSRKHLLGEKIFARQKKEFYQDRLVANRFMLVDVQGFPRLMQALKEGVRLDRTNCLFRSQEGSKSSSTMLQEDSFGVNLGVDDQGDPHDLGWLIFQDGELVGFLYDGGD